MAAAALVLAGCSSGSIDFADAVVPLAAPRFVDTEPVDAFEGGAPHGYAVHGVDVSKYQGDIDWGAVKNAGIAFAFIKATEGGDHVDERLQENLRQTKAAGIPRGAYHFFYFCRPAIEQARWFIRNVPKERGMLPPVLDMEWNAHSPTCTTRPAPETVRAEMRVFIDAIRKHYGIRPVIYTTPEFHEQNIDGHFERETLWLRSVKAHPRVIDPDADWTFWQYTGTGVVPGIEARTDINVFAGSAQQWRRWLSANKV